MQPLGILITTSLAYCACATFSGCGYKFEEAATRVSLSVTWDARRDYAKVTCCRFPDREMAREYIESRMKGGRECDGATVLAEPGDVIAITRLTSGFNSTRLLHNVVVFECIQRNGELKYVMVVLSEAMIEDCLLDLEEQMGDLQP